MQEIHTVKELGRVIEDMKRIAMEIPFDPIKEVLNIKIQLEKITSRWKREIVLDQTAMFITLTYSPLGVRKVWMLSLSRPDGNTLSTTVISRIVDAVFGPSHEREWEIFSMPQSIINPAVVKFMQIVGQSNEQSRSTSPPESN